jgi:hypothetical protein
MHVLAAATGVRGWIVLIVLLVLIVGALYWAFGPALLGLPSMIAVLVVVAGATSIYSNVGLGAVVVIIAGLAAVVVVIGMAMNVGQRRSEGGAQEDRRDEARRREDDRRMR